MMRHYGHGEGFKQTSPHVFTALGAPDFEDELVRETCLERIEENRKGFYDFLSKELIEFDFEGERVFGSFLDVGATSLHVKCFNFENKGFEGSWKEKFDFVFEKYLNLSP